MTIPADHLKELEQRVRDWMVAGQWQRALEEMRTCAVLYGENHDDLVKKVIAQAFAEGHVKPILEVSSLD